MSPIFLSLNFLSFACLTGACLQITLLSMNTTLFLIVACLAAEPAANQPLDVGGDAAAVTAADLAGKPQSLADLQRGPGGKRLPVVLTFWCSFCHSCRHMEKDLDKLAADYRGKANVYALDSSAGETAEMVQEAAKKAGLKLPILLDADGQVADLFGATKTTTTVVLDSEGRVAYVGRFADGEQKYAQQALAAVLAGTAVKTAHTTPKG
ncbi:MAG TPA: TlpA disulfide reductase family protein [Pirellulaceae bacterium]|nr:TlpA disulfide reductase family protein [Pirellulaceae bacterium]